MTPPAPVLAAPCVDVLLLAAGRSRRMGAADKLLLPVGDAGKAQPMVRHAAQIYADLGLPVTVVTSPENDAVTGALAGLNLTLIANASAKAEQPDSLRTGLAAMPLAAPGLLIALAEHPLLPTADISALIDFFCTHPTHICIPRHAGQRGNPVILPQAIARLLRDDSARPTPRAYMDRHPDEIAWFEADHPHFTSDIDTPQDAARLLALSPCHPHP